MITHPLNVHTQMVVHSRDAAELTDRIDSVRECASGPFDPSTFETVEAQCERGHCEASRTVFTPEPLE